MGRPQIFRRDLPIAAGPRLGSAKLHPAAHRFAGRFAAGVLAPPRCARPPFQGAGRHCTLQARSSLQVTGCRDGARAFLEAPR